MKDTLVLIGLATMLGMTIVTFFTFAVAYASPVKAVRVHVNSYGEADLEFVMLSALLPLNIISTIFAIKKLTEKNIESYILRTVELAKRHKISASIE